MTLETEYVSLIGIDPGSDTLGLSCLKIDIKTLNLLSIEAFTFKGSKMFDDEGWSANILGVRNARIQSHKQNLINIFNRIQPLNIAAESSFFNIQRPSAYGALMEVMAMIREAVAEYDPWKHLYLIDPPSVKKAIGASGGSDKIVVRENVLKNYGHLYVDGIEAMGLLDEHSIDAIAVGICRYQNLAKSIF